MDGQTPATLTGIAIAGRVGAWDLTHQGGRITALRPSSGQVDPLRPAVGQGRGLITPLMADIHTHLDKTFTIQRMPRRAESLFDAIEMMADDATRWTGDDIRARALLALTRAWHHGTALMRSHVDWHGAEAPLAWPILCELAQEWRGRIGLQLASLTPLDVLPQIGPAIAARLRADGGILGAFVYRNDDLPAKVAAVFDLAEKYGLNLDFHVDEGLEAQAQGFDAIVAQAEARGMGTRVLCGHCCSLSVREPDQVARLLERAARAGVGLTVLPGANSYLQDASTGRTPRLRGLAPLQEAAQAGMAVMIGSDNVRDGFYPYGDYDLTDVFRLAVVAGHLPPEGWLDAVTTRPAVWMGGSTEIREGGPASFIRHDAADLAELVSRPGAARQIWRDGHVLPQTGDLG